MKCGTVAVVGRANAGKSTLVNVLVGEKVAITSPKPQTTRDRIYGVKTTDDYQIVFEDTPGIYKAKNALNSRMQRTTVLTAKDCDVVMFVVDGHTGVGEEDVETVKKYCSYGIPVVVVVSKTDITDRDRIPENLTALSDCGAKEIIPVSARKGKNVGELLKILLSFMQSDEYVFDPDAVSDKSEKFMIAELMREKILLKYDKEIPHGVAVVVNEFERRENGIYDIKDAETVIEFSQIAEVTPTPTASPTASPTTSPTAGPITEPTATPTASSTAGPITEPTATPTISPTPEQSAKLTENGAEVSADIALEKFEGGERILAAVYNSDRQLVTAKITEITENGNYKLNLDFTPIPTERYTIKLFVWKLHEMKPLNNGYSFGPLGGE